MNRLILTVGLPRSGKSTWARQQGVPMVNPDAIRVALHGKPYLPEAEAMVWTLARYMVKALFLAGHYVVILDATNISASRRREWISAEWDTVIHEVPAEPEVCIQRALDNGQDYLLPVITDMAAILTDEPPRMDGISWKYVD